MSLHKKYMNNSVLFDVNNMKRFVLLFAAGVEELYGLNEVEKVSASYLRASLIPYSGNVLQPIIMKTQCFLLE